MQTQKTREPAKIHEFLCFLISHLFQSCSQLVRTTGWLVATLDALQPSDHLLCLHITNQGTDPLCVTVTATDELRIPHNAILIDTDTNIF